MDCCDNCGTPIESITTTGPATHIISPCGCKANLETRRAAMTPLVPDGGTTNTPTADSRLGESCKQLRIVLEDHADELDTLARTELRSALQGIELTREELQSQHDRDNRLEVDR